MAITKRYPTGESTKDIDWFSLSSPELTGEVELGFTSSRSITGLDKMAQRWTMIFLTPRGTDIYDPNYGTDFYLVRDAAINNESYIRNIITSSINAANSTFKAYQQSGENPTKDEGFYTAVLQDIVFSQERQSVDVYIKIINSLGEFRVLELPTPFNGEL